MKKLKLVCTSDIIGHEQKFHKLKVNTVLRKCDLTENHRLREEARAALRQAAKGKEGFELLLPTFVLT